MNSDGAGPLGGLALSGNTLFGTTEYGGASGNGTVFRVNTDSTAFTNLHDFSYTNDGGYCFAGVVVSGTTLFGLAQGGAFHAGVLYRLNADGTGFTILRTCRPGDLDDLRDLTLSGNILYGTAFCINTDGSGFRNFIQTNFNQFLNSGPNAVALSGNTLYGTAQSGGTASNGVLFSIFVQPQLAIAQSGTNVIVTWPTNSIGFTLQSNTSLTAPVNWNTVTPAPGVLNGLYAVTNSTSNSPMFYRLTGTNN